MASNFRCQAVEGTEPFQLNCRVGEKTEDSSIPSRTVEGRERR